MTLADWRDWLIVIDGTIILVLLITLTIMAWLVYRRVMSLTEAVKKRIESIKRRLMPLIHFLSFVRSLGEALRGESTRTHHPGVAVTRPVRVRRRTVRVQEEDPFATESSPPSLFVPALISGAAFGLALALAGLIPGRRGCDRRWGKGGRPPE